MFYFYFHVSPVSNTMPLKGKLSQTDSTKESVYVLGSFTYGAKLWPACLAVSLGRSVSRPFHFVFLYSRSQQQERKEEKNIHYLKTVYL